MLRDHTVMFLNGKNMRIKGMISFFIIETFDVHEIISRILTNEAQNVIKNVIIHILPIV